MANIMNLKSIRNKTSRNGFDLSFKKNFSAKIGELLPVMCKEVLPGDSFTIDVKALSRTKPLNTAAFARIREYYDFYFVPYELLWNKAFTVLTQMLDNPQHSNSFDPALNTSLSGLVPHCPMSSIAYYLDNMNKKSSNNKNYFGFSRAACSVKLLEYLGYGNFSNVLKTGYDVANNFPMTNVNLNIFGLLAYQKIYSDHFRDSQWEANDPSSYNVDWIKGTSDVNLTDKWLANDPIYDVYNMFDLRYCNWQKDMFHGLVPNAQYGSESVYPLHIPSPYPTVNVSTADNSSRDVLQGSDFIKRTYPIAELSILKLRQYEFLQKWKEVAQVANKDYKDQIKQHWDVNVGDYSSELCQYLGGTSNTIDINEVVNTNITGDNAADIAGKGYGVSNGVIRFNSDGKYGLLMCIYHAVPLIDYTTNPINTAFTKVNATDYAIPEFDKVGMQPVPLAWLNNPLQGDDGLQWSNVGTDILGYAPRYIDYKTSFDESVGSFKRSDSSWVIGFSNIDLYNQYRGQLSSGSPSVVQPDGVNSKIDYTFFKVSPSVVDDIFAVSADDTFDTDQLLNSAFFDCKAVRNLDVDGLPY